MTLSPVVVALAACSSESVKHPICFPVRGQVLYNGKPMVGGKVYFHALPLNENGGRSHLAAAQVEKDGSFQLSSFELHDGAPAGEYAVTFIWTGESGGPGPDLLQNRHGDPNRPVARVVVPEADVQLDPFQLMGPPVDGSAAEKRP